MINNDHPPAQDDQLHTTSTSQEMILYPIESAAQDDGLCVQFLRNKVLILTELQTSAVGLIQ